MLRSVPNKTGGDRRQGETKHSFEENLFLHYGRDEVPSNREGGAPVSMSAERAQERTPQTSQPPTLGPRRPRLFNYTEPGNCREASALPSQPPVSPACSLALLRRLLCLDQV